jgi:hypothetical protein
MLILPFTHEVRKQNNLNIHIIKILTIAGKNIWEESDKLNVDKDILNPNDIYRKGDITKINKNICLCEVDIHKTCIDNFYKWEEVDGNDSDTFCWRKFIYFIDNNNESWLNIPDNEKLGRYRINEIIKPILKMTKVF